MKGKDFRAKKDMEKILSDSRFSHVPFDPKLRHLPKEERKVKLDSRFASMFSDDKFHEKSTMDRRGRKGNYSTKEDLRKFYQLSSDEGESDDDDDDDVDDENDEDSVREDEKEEEDDKGDKENELSNTEESEALEEVSKDNSENKKESSEISKDIIKRLQDMSQDYARGALLFSEDSSDGDSSSEEEQEEEFEWGELDQDAVWDNEQEVEETSRIAVCNLDWNHIKAIDIMVVFNSFCPRGGSVKMVTIYPSEFGKQRLAEEDQFGPKELTAESESQGSSKSYHKDVDLERLEKGKLNYKEEGTKSKFEALRRYERNRLRYYYAVVECDSVETAKIIYKECDRQSFERAGVLMDLRYIPADMTFDEVSHDVCGTVPEFYEAKLFTTTALFDSQPTLTWDQTDPHRQKVLSNAMRNAMSGNKINEEYLKNFIASSSEEEDSLVVEEDDASSDEGEDDKLARIAKFRSLIQEIDEKEKKKANRFNMEEVFGIEDKDDDAQEDVSEDEDDNKKDLNPFEKYLEKRKTKRKDKEKKKKMVADKGEDDSSGEEVIGNTEYSDDELPEGMGDIYNDPFFAEELNKQRKNGKKEKKKKKKEPKEEEKNDNDKGDLELLLMDEDQEEKKHFSMREIIEDHKGKSKKKLRKKAKQKMEEKMKEKMSHVDDFKVDVKDPRFSHLLTSGEYNIDPSHPQFKRTKAMDNLINDVQKKRIADSYESTPDPKRINTSKGREDHELSLLVKRVKSKTNKTKK